MASGGPARELLLGCEEGRPVPGPEPEGGTSRDGRTFADPPGGGGMRRPLAVRLALAVAVVILHK